MMEFEQGQQPDYTERHEHQDGHVSTLIRRRVKPGQQKEYETWLAGIAAEARKFIGYEGIDVIRPNDYMHPEYTIILHFDTNEHFMAFEGSEVRHQWLKRLEHIIDGDSEEHTYTGLEYWFTLPHHPMLNPPPRYKMLLLTMLVSLPLVMSLSFVLLPLLNYIPFLFRSLIILPISLTLMTYCFMPLITRLFARWLYPSKGPEDNRP